jgi:hypothetical protein
MTDFWSRVDRRSADECWPWIGFVNADGYGRLGKRSAHRVAFESVNGPISPGGVVMHYCDNPPCCNPVHLRAGTVADNVADCITKGRRGDMRRPGERHGMAKLDATQVRAIYDDLRSQRVIAAEYGIGQTQVSRIKRGTRWAHLTLRQGITDD